MKYLYIIIEFLLDIFFYIYVYLTFYMWITY